MKNINNFKIPSQISYKNKNLYISNYSYKKIVYQYGTPCVCVLLDRIKENIKNLQAVLNVKYSQYKIFYALKASYLQPILQIISLLNIGVEVLSTLEIEISEFAKFNKNKIIFNGVGRKGEDILNALRKGIIVNIDSIDELKCLVKIKKLSESFNIGIRVHPEFDGDGNFILKNSKLGMTYKDAVKVIRFAHKNNINVNGVSFHIFSNIINAKYHSLAVAGVIHFMNDISKKLSIKFDYIDIGGGFHSAMFFNKKNSIENIIHYISNSLKKYKYNILFLFFELGRYIVADAIIILSRVNAIKSKNNKKWVVIDIGTNYLIPALGYNFPIISCKLTKKQFKYYFVDGICSPSGFIDERYSSKLQDGDIVAVLNAGAYTSVMKEEFVYFSPVHVYFLEKIIRIDDKSNLKNVLKYHNWKKHSNIIC